MNVIGYARVSTNGQVDDGVSLDVQEAKIKDWAKSNEAESVQIFRDEGISGKTADNRPGLKNALEIIGTGDALVAHSLSRFSRSTKDTLEIAESLGRKGADLVSLTEKIDTTSASGKMVFRLLAVLAEFERDQISDRTKAALCYKRSKGEKTGGDVPFGYRARNGKLYPLPGEQKTIKQIMDRRARGESLRKIGCALERQGIHLKKGGSIWWPNSIRQLIIAEVRRNGSSKVDNLKRFERSITGKSRFSSKKRKPGLAARALKSGLPRSRGSVHVK